MSKFKRSRATSTKGHYITNAVLLPAVIEAKQKGFITDKLARMFVMIAERYSFKANFGGYSFREDMVSFALLNLCSNGLKFNPEKSDNPFSFYTTAIHNSFLQYLAHEKNHREIRDKLMIELGSSPSSSFLDSGKDDGTRYDGAYDEHGEISHSGYNEFNRMPEVDVEDKKREKTLTGDAAYRARIEELGLIEKEDETVGGLIKYD